MQPTPFTSFQDAAASVLEFLHRRLGFDLLMVNRVDGPDWAPLHIEAHGYDEPVGSNWRWANEFCTEMVLRDGPTLSPHVLGSGAYTDALPASPRTPIGAFLGVPLVGEDGSLVGTMCGFHPTEKPDRIVADQPLIEIMARFLAGLLNVELGTQNGARRTERALASAHLDPETALYDRVGWEQLLRAEERRHRLEGATSAVVSVTVTPGDPADAQATLEQVADALVAVAREADVAARVGRDAFALLVVNRNRMQIKVLGDRLSRALIAAGVIATVRVARCDGTASLRDCWRAAGAAGR